VEFGPMPGSSAPGGVVTLVGLTDGDVRPAHRSVDGDVPAAW
jgi:hypothetical protein